MSEKIEKMTTTRERVKNGQGETKKLSDILKVNLTKINLVSSLGVSEPKYIVIHSTGNTASAKNENANTVNNDHGGVGAHYSVDEKDIYQTVPDNMKIYHCGTGGVYQQKHPECRNANSVGIEMCQKDMSGTIAPGTIENTALLVQHLMKKHKIDKKHVLRHYDVVSKTCPIAYAGSAEKDAKWVKLKKQLTKGHPSNHML